jgi:hypothetical protein
MKTWRLALFGMMIIMLLAMTTGMAFAQEEEPVEDPDEGESDSRNPVAVFLGEVTGTDYETIKLFQESGYGLGNISKAIFYAGEDGDIAGLMAQAKESGWGQIKKEYAELNPEDKRGGHGLGWLFKAHPDKDKPGNSNRPAWASSKDKGKDWTGGPPPHAGPKDKDDDEAGDAE